jgi:hypothetical protein
MAGTITSANATLTLWQPTLFPSPQQIQQFAADDVFDTDAIRSIEALMGVDGFLSFGFTFVPVVQSFALQANSGSIRFFETIYTQQVAALTVYPISGTILLPSISKKYNMTNGGMTSYKPLPDAKRTLQPQRFQVTWERVLPAPN